MPELQVRRWCVIPLFEIVLATVLATLTEIGGSSGFHGVGKSSEIAVLATCGVGGI